MGLHYCAAHSPGQPARPGAIIFPGLLLSGALTLAGCTGEPLPGGPAPPAPWQDQVTVIDHGWHTSLALPARELTGGLAVFRGIFPGGSTYDFGFGKRTFMIAPVDDPGEWLLGPFPGPGAIQVEALSAPAWVAYAPPVRSVTLALAPGEARRLADAVWAAFRHRASGAPVRIRFTPWHGTLFYASTHGYSLAYTCNAWSAAMLHQAGLRVSASGVVTSGQVMRQVMRQARATR